MYSPKYLDLLKQGELAKRVEKLKSKLESCTICPHKCHVNRQEKEVGFCKSSNKINISSYGPHFGEERCLVGESGSGTIFFTNCVLKCVYCQNYQISQEGYGVNISERRLASIMLKLQKKGCLNINLVSPTQYIPQIVSAIYIGARKGLNLPIVYNTGGYESLETLKLLDNIIDIYMPDFKYSNNELGEKYSGVVDYYKTATKALTEMHRQVGSLQLENNIAYQGLLIRHLVLPNRINDTNKILSFIFQNLSKDTAINIMSQYRPAYKSYQLSKLNRGVTYDEYLEVVKQAKEIGLSNVI